MYLKNEYKKQTNKQQHKKKQNLTDERQTVGIMPEVSGLIALQKMPQPPCLRFFSPEICKSYDLLMACQF